MAKAKRVGVLDAKMAMRVLSDQNIQVDECLNGQQLRAKAEHHLRSLTAREERVLRQRFGLMTPEAVARLGAEEHKTSRERQRQIEVRALRKLRCLNRIRHLVSG